MESCNCSQHSIDGVVEIFEKAIAQELSTLKAQVRKEINELETRSEARKVSDSGFWVKDQLIGRKDALSIPGLKEEE